MYEKPWNMKQLTGSKLGRVYVKAAYCHPAYLTSMQSTSRKIPGWVTHKLESRLPPEISATICWWYQLNVRNWRGTKEPFDEGDTLISEKIGWKLSIHKTKITAFGPITSWQINGEKVEMVEDIIFLCSKITADTDCNHEIKRCLSFGSKAMTNLGSILKHRDIFLPTKVHLVKAMFFSSSHVWMWQLNHKEGWELKNWYFWEDVWEFLRWQGDQSIQS